MEVQLGQDISRLLRDNTLLRCLVPVERYPTEPIPPACCDLLRRVEANWGGSMSLCFASVVLTALLGSVNAAAAPHELYDNVVPADTADCLEKVSLARGRWEIEHVD